MSEKSRLLFIDLLRGWAIIVMIEVHVFNTLLNPIYKENPWFAFLNFVNGLVAPAFLFITGFAFVISTQNRQGELRKFGSYFWKKMARLGLILLVGYSLHLPYFSLMKTIREATPDQITAFYNVDILQTIAIGLLYILLLRTLIKKEGLYYYSLLGSAIFVILSSPFIWSVDFTNTFPLSIANYFNNRQGSNFPIFPWISFIITGAIVAVLYSRAKDNNEEIRFIKIIALLGLVLAVIGHFYLSDVFPQWYRAARPHPVFFFQRLGYVLVLLSLCWLYTQRKKIGRSFIIESGKESLIIYWLHLQILYRRIWNGESIETIIAHTFTPLQSSLFTVGLIALMIIAAFAWGRLKTNFRRQIQIATVVVISGTILIFLLSFDFLS